MGPTPMDELAIILVRGIGLGAVYSLVAISFNVVHSSSGILNFAQGNMLVLGGLFAFFTQPAEPSVTGWLLLVPAAGLLLAAVLGVQGALTLWPLRSSVEQHSWLITTLAVSVIIGAVILIAQGPFALSVRSPFPGFAVLGTRTPTPYLLAVLLALLWCGALHWFHTRTLTGLAMSAIAQDLEAARAAGLRVRRLQLYAFGLSGAIVGSAGFVAAPVLSISADSGIIYVVNGFIAAVIGGLGSNAGALVGGPLVGVASMWAAYRYGGQLQNAVSLALLIGVLMIRPQGLFGRTTARRV
jgi:branched-chain amino acid transport system permease protein